MNKVILIGRLTRETESFNGNNTLTVKFDVAVDRRYKREGQPTSDFFRCVAFGKTAEFIEKYFTKGSKIVIDGEIQNNNWTDQNGQKHYGDQIVVNQAEFGESKATADANRAAANNDTPMPQVAPQPMPQPMMQSMPQTMQQPMPQMMQQPMPNDFMMVSDVGDSGIPFA